jgi:hypothetical protein
MRSKLHQRSSSCSTSTIKIRWQYTRSAAMFHRMMHAFPRTCRQLTGSLKFNLNPNEDYGANTIKRKTRLQTNKTIQTDSLCIYLLKTYSLCIYPLLKQLCGRQLQQN